MTREQKLEEALREVRSHFDVELDDKGRTAAIGYDSKALQKVVKVLDAALSTPKVEAVEAAAWLLEWEFKKSPRGVSPAGQRSLCHSLEEAERIERKLSDYGAVAWVRRTPLYASPAPAITDDALERAADEIADTAVIDFNGSITNRHDVARAAIFAAFPRKGEGE